MQTYKKRVLTADNSAVVRIEKEMLLIKLQSRLPDDKQEFVVTTDDGL